LFESISGRFQDIFRHMRGWAQIDDKALHAAMRDVRRALLEADVNYRVAKEFCAEVSERALGVDVTRSVNPGQEVIRIVHECLVEMMGEGARPLRTAPTGPTVIMLVGLQGQGKTTAAAKLAVWAKGRGRSPMLAACDLQRPAAPEQLAVLAEGVGVPCHREPGASDPILVARAALSRARRGEADTLIIDTAGRLHVDDALMAEIARMAEAVAPQEILLVADAMTGQDAVSVAEAFSARLPLTGVILAKLDGDARGGAALTLRKVAGQPIIFASVGETPADLEPFHPERMATRILGMGDVVSLVEKAREAVDEEKARELARKVRRSELDLSDFLEQMRAMRKMGGAGRLLSMIPGLPQGAVADIDEGEIERMEAVILSMTPQERARPEIINGSRRKRIAMGSGTSVQAVNRLLKDFNAARKMMSKAGRTGLSLPGMPGGARR